MLKQVRSSLPKFRTTTFDSGFNVVLANIVEDSNETESTNGLGKTTLLRIIHFCLGATVSRDRVISHPQLAGVSFGLTFVYGGDEIRVDRKTNEETVAVTSKFLDGVSIEVISTADGVTVISADDWERVLSAKFLPDARIPDTPNFSPTFREVAGYLIRLSKPAFVDPQQAFANQKGTSKRLILSYLLGLNWQAQRELDGERSKRDQVNSAIKALEDAKSSTDEHSIGDLEAQRVVLDTEIESKRGEVANFRVRDDYRSLEDRLNAVDRRIHDLVNANHADARLLEYYQRSAKEAPEVAPHDPIAILKEAGAVFQADALRSLEEVAEFHAQVYKNRADFLAAEIARLKTDIAERRATIDLLSGEKTSLLQLLKSSGALETFIDLQRDLSEIEAKRDALVGRIEERKRFDIRKDTLSESIIQSRGVLKRDLEDRRQRVDEAIGLFAEYTQQLYGAPGRLSIDIKDSGYVLGFSIQREGSDGVDQMVVFCFDLVVATLRARRSHAFVTLIHDSSMFADVDPRQYGVGLQLARRTAEKEGFQYICCLNEGALPQGHLGELKLEDFVKLRLTDTDDGRLLGMRLPPREK